MKRKRILLLLGLLVLVVIAGAAVGWQLLMTGRLNPWQSVTVTFRDGTEVRFERQRSHPTQAEYRRRCAVHTSAGMDKSLTLPYDPGGGFPVELRLHSDGVRSFLVVTGADDYALELRTGTRAFWEDGKYSRLPLDDARLPKIVDAFLVDRMMAAERMTPSN